MLIDWFTVGAQVVNFLILVWLLRRFLYRPISDAMAERQRRIDEQLAEAERLRSEASAEGERLRGEAERFEAQREERARQLREELADQRRDQLAHLRNDIDELQARWRHAVAREREGLLLELRQRTGQQIVEVARHALADLANESLEEHVIERFLCRLRGLDDTDRNTLVTAADNNGRRLHLRSAFEVPQPLRDRLASAVEATVGPDFHLRFDVVPALLGGVELRAGGQALAWTFDEYLESLESVLADALGQEWEPRTDD